MTPLTLEEGLVIPPSFMTSSTSRPRIGPSRLEWVLDTRLPQARRGWVCAFVGYLSKAGLTHVVGDPGIKEQVSLF